MCSRENTDVNFSILKRLFIFWNLYSTFLSFFLRQCRRTSDGSRLFGRNLAHTHFVAFVFTFRFALNMDGCTNDNGTGASGCHQPLRYHCSQRGNNMTQVTRGL